MSYRNSRGLVLLSAGHAYNDMYFFLFPMLIPIFAFEFSLSYIHQGLIMSTFFLTTAVFSTIWGALGVQLGYGRLLALGFVTAAAGLLLVTQSTTYGLLLVFVGVTSMGVSTFHPIAIALASGASADQGRWLGVFEASGAAGGIAATLLLALALANLDWQWSTAAFAFPGILLAYSFWKTALPEAGTARQAKYHTAPRTLIHFFAARVIRSLGAGSMIAFLPTLLMQNWDLTAAAASTIYATFFVGGIIGGLLFGHLAQNVDHIRLMTAAVLVPVLLIFALTQSIPLPLGLLLLLLLGTCFSGFFPPHNRWIAEHVSDVNRSTFFGLGMTLETIAQAAAPGLVGALADQIGFTNAFRTVALPWIGSAVVFLLLIQRQNALPAAVQGQRTQS